MSTAQFAVLGRGVIEPSFDAQTARRRSRGVSLTTFMFLAAYASLRWSTMLQGSGAGRMFGLLALTAVIGWLGGHLAATRLWARAAALIGIVLAALAMIPMSGFPLRWMIDLRIAVVVRGIGRGLSALPHVIVPYSGGQVDTAGVIVLGAGMLLLAGILPLCTPRLRIGQARLVAAAVPVIVLAIVPSVLAEPHLAGVHGVILFLLLVAFLFSDRVAPRRVSGALCFALLTAIAALVLTPSIETSRAWINVRTIGAGRTHFGERFNWDQTYTRLDWPRQGTDVLTVQARFASYWKAEDIDLFNGSDWVSTSVAAGSQLVGVSHASLARWTEPLTVTLGEMATSQVIAAGVAGAPTQSRPLPVIPGNGPGTWQTPQPLGPGTSYHVDVYSPSPSRQQLLSAPASYPSVLAPELQLILPASPRSPDFAAADNPIQFRPFGSAQHLEPYGGLDRSQEASLVRKSPYDPVFRLAMRLRAGARAPYAYLEAILHYLAHGFTYDQTPPTGRNPLLTFLLHTHQGYCQQFAGAMALLLRMGGVPARVAAGFTSGTYDTRDSTFAVSDLDAHSWVEAWFAGYGWVTFDPTPPSDPALSGHVALPAGQSSPASTHGSLATGRRNHPTGAAALKGPRRQSHRSHRPGAGVSLLPFLLVLLLGLLIGLGALAWRAPHTPEALMDELERGMARVRRPLSPDVTLARLEQRFADVPEAAGYVRALRQARYGGGAQLPTAEQRRALRRRLGRELGRLGRLRALIALPPLVRRLH